MKEHSIYTLVPIWFRFDKNGDRSEGFYAFDNSDANGEVHYFGYFYQDGNKLSVSVDYDDIIWPDDFTRNNMVPRSHTLTRDQIQDISLIFPLAPINSISLFIIISF